MLRILKIAICIIFGYLIGSFNPASLFARHKKTNLRTKGTKNLGATNSLLVLGTKYGIAVLFIDMTKAYLAVILSGLFVSEFSYAGLLSGAFAVAGHVFPFYLNFKGGKGLAPFAGTILAFDPYMFITLLLVCVTIMLILDYTVALPWSGACLFPFMTAVKTGSIYAFLIALSVSSIIIIKHFRNFKNALQGEDSRIRPYIRKLFNK